MKLIKKSIFFIVAVLMSSTVFSQSTGNTLEFNSVVTLSLDKHDYNFSSSEVLTKTYTVADDCVMKIVSGRLSFVPHPSYGLPTTTDNVITKLYIGDEIIYGRFIGHLEENSNLTFGDFGYYITSDNPIWVTGGTEVKIEIECISSINSSGVFCHFSGVVFKVVPIE